MFRSWYLLVAAAVLLASSFFVQLEAHAAPPPAPTTVVVLVGGLGSSSATDALNFAPLVGQLIVRQHTAVRGFFYGGSAAAYTSERSCQPIAQSTAELVDFVRGLRDSGIAPSAVLVGHSNGGVIALDALAAAPDLAPFVRRVVTVDSPLGGVKVGDAFLYGAAVGECGAVDELYARHATPGWSDYLAQLVEWERGLGTDVAIIVNPRDALVGVDEQQVLGVDVNYALEADGPDWTNHGAVLHSAEVLPRLAAIVAAP